MLKEKLIAKITSQISLANGYLAQLDTIDSEPMLDNLVSDYEKWDDVNSHILKNGFVMSQLFRMYSGASYLGNVNDTSYKAKREKLKYCLPRKLPHLNTTLAHLNTCTSQDLYPIAEQYLEVSNNINSTNINMKKVFISHASKDKEIIQPLVDLIEDIGVPHSQIFFSSNVAYGVGLGENIFERLKTELNSDVFALFILSENFYKSEVCLCEMGAVWIKSNKQIPILIPPFDFKDIKGVFPNALGFKIDNKDHINTLKLDLENYFGLKAKHPSLWEQKREGYLNKVAALTKSLTTSPKRFFVGSFNLQSVIKNDAEEVFLLGQNLQSILVKDDNYQLLKYFVLRGGKLSLFLTPPNILKEVHSKAETDQKETIAKLIELKSELATNKNESNLKVYFHPSTISLSAIIVKTKEQKESMIFTVKWAQDEDGANRLHCTLDEEVDKEAFNKLNGHIPNMMQTRSDTMTFEQVKEYHNLSGDLLLGNQDHQDDV